MNKKLPLWIFILILSAACNESTKDPANDNHRKFIGKWTSKSISKNPQSISITSINQDGAFIEMEKFNKDNATQEPAMHEGEWFFDGINFKRKYTKLNNKPLSNSQFGYVTCTVKSLTKSEFLCIDNSQKDTIRFTKIESEIPSLPSPG